MRYFHVINVRWYNATAWYALNLCRLLKQAGHSVTVAVLPGTPVAAKAHEMGLETYETDLSGKRVLPTLKALWHLGRFIDRLQPEEITCHRGELFGYFALKRFFQKPRWRLIRVRGDERRPKSHGLNRFLHRRCVDRIVVSGAFIKRWFVEDMRIPESMIRVIHGGVDTDRFRFDPEGRARVRREFGFDETAIVVGLVGRYSSPKGHSVLMEAIAQLRQNDPRYKLLFVSDSGSWNIADLKAAIEAGPLKSHAFVTGFRADVVACMSALDVGVVASVRSEAICRVAFELMAVGVPLVSTTVGALPEIAPPANLVPPNEPQALAQAIAQPDRTVRLFSDEAFVQGYLQATQAASDYN